MIKTLSKVGIEETYLNLIKLINNKLTANSISKGKNLKATSLKISNKTGMSTFTSLIQHSTGSPRHINQTRGNKRHPHWNEKSKTVIFCRWHDIVHRIH